MGELTINKIDAELLEELKIDAERHGVSPGVRAAELLRNALHKPRFKTERARIAYEISRMSPPSDVDSTDIIRAERDR